MKKIVAITFLLMFLGWARGYGWPIPDTGQTKCYDDTQEIPCPDPGEPYYGQDGNYTINPMSFTKLDASGNELPDEATEWAMVRDNVTGLIWEIKHNRDDVKDYSNPNDADNTYTWYDPNSETNGGDAGTPGDGTDTYDFINDLNAQNYGGYSDWRMPTREELRSIVDCSIPYPGPTIDMEYFPNTRSSSYWSSTTYADDTDYAWGIYFGYGYDYHYNKSDSKYVRAVRGGQSGSLDHWVINGDGTVTDKNTGLMWEVKTDDGGNRDKDHTYTWRDALNYCENLNLAGYSDWRLPTIKELAYLVDLMTYNPAIDTGYFPNARSSYYWSSTTCADDTSSAWSIYFNNGSGSRSNKYGHRYVRAVRAGQSGLFDNLVISTPKASSAWQVDNTMAITWQTQDIPGDVKISLSRYGENGTYETLIAGTPNDGQFDWTVAGPASANCYLKIEPLLYPSKGATQGPFAIVLSTGGISVATNLDAASFTLTGPETYTGSGKSWSQSDAPVGEYTITYDVVDCWQTPVSETQTLAENGGIFFTGTYIDNTAPSSLVGLNSFPTVQAWTDSDTVTVGWSAATDCGSGVAGYSYLWDAFSDTIPGATVDSTLTMVASPSLPDGDHIYFHISAIDNAGNAGAPVHLGPFYIDTSPPVITSFTINKGDAATSSQNVELQIIAEDPLNGLNDMQLSNDLTNWTTTAYSQNASWEITPDENGFSAVFVKVSDGLNHWTSPVFRSIYYTQTQGAPDDPAGLFVNAVTSESVEIGWPSTSDTTVFYHVYRSLSEDGVFYRISDTPLGYVDLDGQNFHFVDDTVEEGVIYYYKIRAFRDDIPSTGFSNIVTAETTVSSRFALSVLETQRIVTAGDVARYFIQLLPKENFEGNIELSCTDISNDIDHTFVMGNTNSGSVISVSQLPVSVIFHIDTPENTPEDVYVMTITATHHKPEGTTDTVEQEVRLTVISFKEKSVGVEVEHSEIRKGEPNRIFGKISPAKENQSVHVTVTDTDTGNSATRRLETDAEGVFENSGWIPTLNYGIYAVVAQWTDNIGKTYLSQTIAFSVKKEKAALKLYRKPGEKAILYEDFTIQGLLNPPMSNEKIILEITSPSGNTTSRLLYTDGNGLKYEITDTFFNENGVWMFKTYFEGNTDYIGCESEVLEVPVGIDFGRSIIVGGGKAELSNTTWTLTKYLTLNAYRSFYYSGFDHPLNYYMLNSQIVDFDYDDIPDNIVDDVTPNKPDFLNMIQTAFSGDVDSDTPLFIFLMGHGTSDGTFRVYDSNEIVTAAEINDAVTALQANTKCDVVIIIESCYSGVFIKTLSAPGRVIVTSAGDEVYNTDKNGYYAFSRILFSKLQEGDNLLKAYRYTRKKMVNMNFPMPLLDDNGDGKADQNDGAFASNFYLDGLIAWGVRPEISEIDVTTVLEGADSTEISVKVTPGVNPVATVWAQVIPPEMETSEDRLTLDYPNIELTYDSTAQSYKGTLTDLAQSGIYKILVSAVDEEHMVSDPGVANIGVTGAYEFGDLNADKLIDIRDAIIGLKIISGIYGSSQLAIDLSGTKDNIDMKAVIYILQRIASVRVSK